jgi:hypothetical protein
MSWLRPSGAAAAPVLAEEPPAPPVDIEHAAPGFKQAADRLPRPGASVLDLGPALAANVAFFRRLQARLRVSDLEGTLAEAGIWSPPKKLGRWPAQVASVLSAGSDEQYDLILTWDFSNFLGRERWPAVAELLVERLRPTGVVHLLARTGREMPALPGQFRITAADTIRETPRVTETVPPPRFSHGEIERLHPGLAAARSFLDKHSVQEFLLEHADVLNLPPRPVAQPRKPRSHYPG